MFFFRNRIGPLRANPARDAFLDCSCNCKTLAHHSVQAHATQTPRDSKEYYQMRPRQAERLCLFIQAIIHNVRRSRAAPRWKSSAKLWQLDDFDTNTTGPVITFDMTASAAPGVWEYAGACGKLNRLVSVDLSLLDSPNAPTTLFWRFAGELPTASHGCSDLYWSPFPEGGGSAKAIEGCRFDFDDLQGHVRCFSCFPIMLSWSHADMVAVKVEDNPLPDCMSSDGVGVAKKQMP